MTEKTHIEELTRAEIQRQEREYSAREKELTRQLIAIYAARQSGMSEPAIADRDKAVRLRAKEMLNGHGHLLPALKDGQSEEQIYVERDAVRLILKVLRDEETEVLAAEALNFARTHSDEWREIARGWVLAAAKLLECEARAAEFQAKAFGADLPLCEFVGRGIVIDVPGVNVEIVFASALKEKLLTAGELKGARNAKSS